MGTSSTTLHEDGSVLSPETVDRHRAIVSLMEELEAIDWYDQRVDATDDEELRAVLAHNRDEEKEHAVMTLEWLRRHDPVLDANLRRYLFSDEPLGALSDEAEHGETGGPQAPGAAGGGGGGGGGAGGGRAGLRVGDLRGGEGL